MATANIQLPQTILLKLYRNHKQGAIVRSAASLFMWLFALWAYVADNIQDDHLVGISCSVVFLVGMNPPTLFVLKRISHKRTLVNFSLLINYLEIIGYTGVIYFLGGIEATYLTVIYAALITYVGAFSRRGVPYLLAGFAALAFGTMELLSGYEIIPTFRVDPYFNLTPLSIIMRVCVIIGLLLVVAFISSFTASRLKLSRDRLRQQNKKLEDNAVELKQTQAKLVQSGKLASIGQLASGVAHELNQPLMVIRGTVQLLNRNIQQNKRSPKEDSKQLKLIEKNTSRMMKIINHLRTFSRQSKNEFAPVSINAILEDSLLMVGEQLRLHNIKVKKMFAENLPKIHGNANQLEQVFLNLITNAKDAIEESSNHENNSKFGTIEITTRKSKRKLDCVALIMRDTGCGIAAVHIPIIFDPFFTTKDVGKGTGLGLSISYGIIQEHNGEIEILETDQKGTTFRIILPTTTSQQANRVST